MPPKNQEQEKINNNFLKKTSFVVALFTVFCGVCGYTVYLLHDSAVSAIGAVDDHVKEMNMKINNHDTRLTIIETENKAQKSTFEEVRQDLKDSKKTLSELQADMKVIKTIILKNEKP
jgi:septal ring factor EnvC (AmiA/AmiB activator)